jgi:hypothetical protein
VDCAQRHCDESFGQGEDMITSDRRRRAERFQPVKVRPASKADANAEFAEPPSDGLKWGLSALIAFALIDWFAAKLF